MEHALTPSRPGQLVDPNDGPRANPDPAAGWLPRIVFLILLGFGTVMVFLLPPNQSPDEGNHFFRTIMLSEGRIFTTQMDGHQGWMIPVSLRDYMAANKPIVGKEAAPYNYHRWVTDSQQTSPKEPRVFTIFWFQAISPLMYIPQVSGVLVGKLVYRLIPAPGLSFNWPAALYFSRLGNLFAFAALTALAIRTLPRFRSLVAAIALLPMTVHLASSASYDTTPFVTALWLLTVVTTVCVRRSAPKRWEIVVLALTAFFLGHAKGAYAPLLLSIIALKPAMTWRAFIQLSAGLFALAVMGAISGNVPFGLPAEPDFVKAVTAQKAHLLANVTAIPRLMLYDLKMKAWFYFTSFFGNLGWLDTQFAVPVLAFLFALLLLAIFADALQGPPPLGWLGGAATLLGAALSVFATMLTVYLIWTSHTLGIGAPTVEGMQGRYFLPVAIFVAAAIAGMPNALRRPLLPLRPRLIEVGVVCQSAILGLTLFVLAARYWFS